MKTSTKTLLAAAISGYLALIGTVSATNVLPHKLIEVRSDSNKNVVINVDGQTVTLTPEELENDDLLELRLSKFDDQTRETLMQTIEGTRHMFTGEGMFTRDGHFDLSKIKGAKEHKMIMVNGGDGEIIKEMFIDDENVDVIVEGDEDKVIHKQIIIGSHGEHATLTGHTDVIVKMIERGEFSQDDLNKIQMALDTKR